MLWWWRRLLERERRFGPAVGSERERESLLVPPSSSNRPPRSSSSRAGAPSAKSDGTLVLTRTVPLERAKAIGTDVDPVHLEIFNNLFMAVAEEMGVALQSTATSVNIKERLDFSCAIFDAEGALIANAPHIPVHLGSMGESIRQIIDTRGHERDGRGIRRGDAYVLNDPYRGGTHLPDITVVVPVFYEDEAEPSAFVAARGHHADIGGIAPGSMPPDSRTIDEEGVLIDNFLMVDEGHFREPEMRALLACGEWPARNPDRNISDLKAQLAACTRGAEVLVATARDYGADVVAAYMRHVLANAEESVRRLLDRLDDGEFDYEMDNGAHVRVRITIDKRGALGDLRLHRHQRAAARQFQRALFDREGGIALCGSHADRRRDPDERWLPSADRAGRAGRVDAQPAISGRSRRGKCRDEPGRHRRALSQRPAGSRQARER